MPAYQDLPLDQIVQQLTEITDTRMSQLIILFGIILAILYFWTNRGAKRHDDSLLGLVTRQQRLLERFDDQMTAEREYAAAAQKATREHIEQIAGDIRAAVMALADAMRHAAEASDKRHIALEQSLVTLDSHIQSLQKRGSEPVQVLAARLVEIQDILETVKTRVETDSGNLGVVVRELEAARGDIQAIQRSLKEAITIARQVVKRRTGEIEQMNEDGHEHLI